MSTSPPLIPLSVDMSPTSTPSAGAIRFNTDLFEMEYWDGSRWVSSSGANEPTTVWGWIDRYATDNFVQESDNNRKAYINLKMQQRFPGKYAVNCNADDEWVLSFSTPEDETLFWLKYS